MLQRELEKGRVATGGGAGLFRGLPSPTGERSEPNLLPLAAVEGEGGARLSRAKPGECRTASSSRGVNAELPGPFLQTADPWLSPSKGTLSLGLHTRVDGELSSSITNPFGLRFQRFGDFFSGLKKLMSIKAHNCPRFTEPEYPWASPSAAANSCVCTRLLPSDSYGCSSWGAAGAATGQKHRFRAESALQSLSPQRASRRSEKGMAVHVMGLKGPPALQSLPKGRIGVSPGFQIAGPSARRYEILRRRKQPGGEEGDPSSPVSRLGSSSPGHWDDPSTSRVSRPPQLSGLRPAPPRGSHPHPDQVLPTFSSGCARGWKDEGGGPRAVLAQLLHKPGLSRQQSFKAQSHLSLHCSSPWKDIPGRSLGLAEFPGRGTQWLHNVPEISVSQLPPFSLKTCFLLTVMLEIRW